MSQGTLILGEHDNQRLNVATLNTLTAAKELKQPVTILIAGNGCEAVAKTASQLSGVERVLWVEDPVFENGLAEPFAALLAEMGKNFTAILAPATIYGKNILPRAAALLGVGMISEITKIISPDTFIRPMYAGNAFATVKSLDPIRVMTVRSTAFAASPNGENLAVIEKLSFDKKSLPKNWAQFLGRQKSTSHRPELTVARVVIAGGRGLKSADNFKLLENIADKLQAAIGASRAAVDAGYITNDHQVGQTGKVVAPDLYIAVGISGAIQHLAGMKDSKVIVAINQDSEAPIFQVADYGIVGDLFEILPALDQELATRIR